MAMRSLSASFSALLNGGDWWPASHAARVRLSTFNAPASCSTDISARSLAHFTTCGVM
jgi:hypothetical protein